MVPHSAAAGMAGGSPTMNIILLVVGLSSGFAHSVYSAISKALLKSRVSEPFLLFFYISLLQAILTPSLWIVVYPQFPSPAAWPPLLVSSATCVAAYLFLYTALHYGDVSSVMPIMGSKVVFAALLAIPLLGEAHSRSIYIACVLVAVAIAMLSYSPSHGVAGRFPLKPIVMMTACSVLFGFTDISIKRTLVHLDFYNFMVYYNFLVGILALCIIPYLRVKGVGILLRGKDLGLCFCAAISLATATLLFAVLLKLCNGVVIPNILQSTRGIFVVGISAALSYRGSTALERQSRHVYMLRLAASILITVSIWIALTPLGAAG